MRRLTYLLFAFIFTFSCQTSRERPESGSHPSVIAKWPDAVAYEIFVQSYADSDGDGIGDIEGMTSRLDYLQDLGVKGVWLMPIMPSPSYHKYDVTDYYNVHPQYGNLDIFKKFVQEAHKRDIKVIMDMVINHTSDQHPWFLNALKGDTARYRNFYIWATDEEIAKFSAHEKEITGDSDNLTQWHTADGNTKTYYGFFTGTMPDLNYDNPDVRAEVIKISKFWLQEMGVDGFRLDAAKHIYEDSRLDDSRKWWVEYREALRRVKPDVYLVGEVWDDAAFVAPFSEGLPALFNFDLAVSMIESVEMEHSVSAIITGPTWKVTDSLNFEQGYLHTQSIFKAQTSDYHDAIFLTNHDQNRILSVLGNNIKKGKLAASLLLTMPGTPYLYYGEEIGMPGMKPDPNIREPFLWAPEEQDSIRTHWIKPEYSTKGKVTPLSLQKDDNNSIYRHYRRLIHLRNNSPALTHGTFKNAEYGNGNVLAFYRKSDDEKLLIYHNLSYRQVSLQLSDDDRCFTEELFSNGGKITEAKDVVLEPYSSLILRCK